MTPTTWHSDETALRFARFLLSVPFLPLFRSYVFVRHVRHPSTTQKPRHFETIRIQLIIRGCILDTAPPLTCLVPTIRRLGLRVVCPLLPLPRPPPVLRFCPTCPTPVHNTPPPRCFHTMRIQPNIHGYFVGTTPTPTPTCPNPTIRRMGLSVLSSRLPLPRPLSALRFSSDMSDTPL